MFRPLEMKLASLAGEELDAIVRRRLAQKMTFLIEDTKRLAEPSDEVRRESAALSDAVATP